MGVEDILDEDRSVDLVALAAQCREDEILREEVKSFIKRSGLASVVKRVLAASGVPMLGDRKTGLAESLFAHGSLTLTVLASAFVDDAKSRLLKDGHSKEPCRDDPACPFQNGHPIHVANAISGSVVEEFSPDAFNFMRKDQTAAEA